MTRTAAILSLATLGAVMAVLANPRMVTSHFLASDREKAGQLMPAAHAEARSQEPSRSSPPDGTQVSGGRAWLGIRMATVTPEIAQKADLHATAGAVVVDVVPNSPAAAAGLSPGDIITKIGKTTVSTADDCRRPIAASPIGRPLVLRVLRGTVARIVVVTPTAAPEQAHNTTLPEVEKAGRDPQLDRALGLAYAAAAEAHHQGNYELESWCLRRTADWLDGATGAAAPSRLGADPRESFYEARAALDQASARGDRIAAARQLRKLSAAVLSVAGEDRKIAAMPPAPPFGDQPVERPDGPPSRVQNGVPSGTGNSVFDDFIRTMNRQFEDVHQMNREAFAKEREKWHTLLTPDLSRSANCAVCRGTGRSPGWCKYARFNYDPIELSQKVHGPDCVYCQGTFHPLCDVCQADLVLAWDRRSDKVAEILAGARVKENLERIQTRREARLRDDLDLAQHQEDIAADVYAFKLRNGFDTRNALNDFLQARKKTEEAKRELSEAQGEAPKAP